VPLAACPLVMLSTAPPPARECHGFGCCWGPHDSEEPSHAGDYDNRSRYREVGLSGSRRWCRRPSRPPSPIEASLCSGVLPEGATVPGWYRGLCVVTSLV